MADKPEVSAVTVEVTGLYGKAADGTIHPIRLTQYGGNGGGDGNGSEYILPAATKATLGGVKVGDNLEIESDGTLNANGTIDGGVV